MITPLHIQFAIAIHISNDPELILSDIWGSEAGKEIKKWMMEEGLVDWNLRPTYGTSRLAAWIDHLCKQPRKYTVTEIDQMRKRLIERYPIKESASPLPGESIPIPTDATYRRRMERSVKVEDQLRTYMLNGTDPGEME